MELIRTGLFVPVDKTTLLLGTASPSLQNLCHVRAVIGPTRREDKCCEILLLPLSKLLITPEKCSQAQVILRNYLSLLVNGPQKMCNERPPDFISMKRSMSNGLLANGSNDIEASSLSSTALIVEKNVHCNGNPSLVPIQLSQVPSNSSSGPSVAKIPAVQSPTISNTGDIEVVDLVGDNISNLQSITSSNNCTVLESHDNEQVKNSSCAISESKKILEGQPSEIILQNKTEDNKEVTADDDDDDDVIICTEKEIVIDLDENNKDSKDTEDVLSITNNSSVLLVDDDGVVVLSEDSSKSDINDILSRRKRKRKCNKELKRKGFSYAAKYGSDVASVASDNIFGEKCSSNKSNNKYSSILLEKNNNVETLINNIANSVRALPTLDFSVHQSGANNDNKNDEASVIDVESSDRCIDEINLVSDNECEENESCNDIENNFSSNVNNSNKIEAKTIFQSLCVRMERGRKKRNRDNLKAEESRRLKELGREDLVKECNNMSPFLKRKKNKKKRKNLLAATSFSRDISINTASISSDHSVKSKPESLQASISKTNTCEAEWSRPAHLAQAYETLIDSTHNGNNLACAASTSNFNPPLIIRNFSNSSVCRKRTASSVQGPDSSPAKRSKTDSVGTNVCMPDSDKTGYIKSGLRPIVIDASNVAFSHGRNVDFSFKGVEMCIKYFKKRGHDQVIAIMPNFRKGLVNQKLLNQWQRDGTLVFTPSRKVNGHLIVSHDDRYIIQCAAALEGVIVSQDNYREFIGENPLWDDAIKNRLLMFTWVGDVLIFPDDPLGRNGPKLDNFLKFPSSSSSLSTLPSSKR